MNFLQDQRFYAAVITVVALLCATALVLTGAVSGNQAAGLLGIYTTALAWWAKSPAA